MLFVPLRPGLPRRVLVMLVLAPSRVRAAGPALGVWLALSLASIGSACSEGEPKRAEESAPAPAETPATAAQRAEAAAAVAAGLQLVEDGELQRAETEFERARTLDPGSAEAHYYLGQLRVQRSGNVVDSTAMAFAKHDMDLLEAGIAELVRALELAPENAEYALALGRAYHEASDLENARRHLEKAAALRPDDAIALKRLGMVYLALAETELARATFEKAVALEPKDANSVFHLGQALETLRDFAGARAAYAAAIERNPTQPEYHRKLLAVLERLGDREAIAAAERELARWVAYDEKLERRQRYAERNPKDPATVRRLGEVYLEGNRWKLASDWCAKALRLDPNDVSAHLCCAIALRGMRQFEAAAEHLRAAEGLAPDLLDVPLELVRLHAASGDEAGLRAVVARVERKAARDGAVLFDLGSLCRELGREDDATRLLAQAAALGVTAPPARALAESDGDPGQR
jgi:tetratricopeptide (TPR) repeat protein